jgi:transcriptional regulator with XRE-family HTH domain
MEIYERIRELRKMHLKLSQEEFGKKLGVTRSVIKNIELNVLARPEQKEPLIKLICREFNVNETWLRNGEGEVFLQALELDETAAFISRFLEEEENPLYKIMLELMRTYEQSNTTTQEAVRNYCGSFIENLRK